jgi:DNA-binding PadR family transcriptional regulator
VSEALKPHWFHILLALAGAPLHGTAIVEEVLERTRGGVRLWPGTLYGSLRDLEGKGFIAETDPPADAPTEGGKRRFYRITPSGEAVLRREVAVLRGILDIARERDLLGDAGAG